MTSVRALALLLAVAPALAAHADTLDRPTAQRRTLRGSSRAIGSLTRTVGFPAYTYRAATDGFARVDLQIANAAGRPHDNGGRAWRPYLRILTEADVGHGEGWSTNGRPGDPDAARATLLMRVRAGEAFTIVATVCEDMTRDAPAVTARYTLVVAEFGP